MKKEINGKNSKKDTIWTIIGIATILCFFWGLWNYSMDAPNKSEKIEIDSLLTECSTIHLNCQESCWDEETNVEKILCENACISNYNYCITENHEPIANTTIFTTEEQNEIIQQVLNDKIMQRIQNDIDEYNKLIIEEQSDYPQNQTIGVE